jgi:hypothetical protein
MKNQDFSNPAYQQKRQYTGWGSQMQNVAPNSKTASDYGRILIEWARLKVFLLCIKNTTFKLFFKVFFAIFVRLVFSRLVPHGGRLTLGDSSSKKPRKNKNYKNKFYFC